jgi:DNA (cytosine-5)-methyltransferase 1
LSQRRFEDKDRTVLAPSSLRKPDHPITLSLFSGGGGLDIGFHQAGFRIVACVEINVAACNTLRANVGRYLEPDCHIVNKDIGGLAPEDITHEKIDFIIGGPPCQSFSAIGRRAGGVEGTQDDRGNLFEHYCRLVRHFQPVGFLFENVRGILSSNGGQDWKLIVGAFADLGYQISYRVLDCADYGVPQHRERLILIGTRGGRVHFPRPTHGPDSALGLPHVTAAQAIADLQDPNEPNHTYNGKYGHLLSEVPPGQNYHYFTREMGYPNPLFAWRSRFSDFLYKADPSKPVRTIVAKLGAYSGPLHWKNRKFTLEEFKRLQSFPDDYQFVGGLGAALQQIGNSVPPKFAEQLARCVKQQLFGVDMGVEVIEDTEKLSFDSRKSRKAQSTRSKRLTKSISHQASLFDLAAPSDMADRPAIRERATLYYLYTTHRARKQIGNPSHAHEGRLFQFERKRVNDTCSVVVTRFEDWPTTVNQELLRYNVAFHHPIGNGLSRITATLLSSCAEDISVVWDAIEDTLSEYSGYRTMMDVYGHFTEPHPIFNLTLETLSSQNSFLLRFAERFSSFEACSKVLPAHELESLMEGDSGDGFDLAETARYLRGLRFDVRVHETNATIARGYFRCCYPFTININKQVSVSWKDSQGVISW